MINRTILLATLAVLGVSSAVPAVAQTAPAITVGAQVKDAQGGTVGTISSVSGGNAVIKTDKHEVALPTTSFAKGDSGFVIGMTQAQLDAAFEQAMAKAQQALVVGATVKDPQGGTVGTIAGLDEQFVTLQLAGSEAKAKLPRSGVAATAEGPVIGLTLAQLQAQVGAAAPAALAAGSSE